VRSGGYWLPLAAHALLLRCDAGAVLSSALAANYLGHWPCNLWLRIDVCVGVIALRNSWSSAFTPVAGVQSCAVANAVDF
jgi:hypothetical protein